MEVNLCDSLLRKSVDNHILTYRRNRRENELLEKKFSFYERQFRVVHNSIHTAEYRFEQHAKNDLGLVISYKHKALEPSLNQQFYYSTSKKYWTTREYVVQPAHHVLQHKNLYEHALERRSKQYTEELKRKNRLLRLRQEQFINHLTPFTDDDDEEEEDGNYHKPIDWPLSDNARIKLPSIHQSKLNSKPTVHFSIEL